LNPENQITIRNWFSFICQCAKKLNTKHATQYLPEGVGLSVTILPDKLTTY